MEMRKEFTEQFKKDWEKSVEWAMGSRSLYGAYEALYDFDSKFQKAFSKEDFDKLEKIDTKLHERMCSLEEGLAEFKAHFGGRFSK